MATIEQPEPDRRRRNEVGWIINFGLAWTLAMALCAQRWPAEGLYIFLAASLGASGAIGLAVYRSRGAKIDASNGRSESPVRHEAELGAAGRAAVALAEDVRSKLVELESFAAARRRRALVEQRLVEEMLFHNKLIETRSQQTYRALLSHILELRETRNISAHRSRHPVQRVDLRHAVGKHFMLDFGTVTIEIDGENARIDLTRASRVDIVRPEAAGANQAGGLAHGLVGGPKALGEAVN